MMSYQKNDIILYLARHFGEKVSSRMAIRHLINSSDVKEMERVIIDFNDVSFLSHSAADQLLKERERLEQQACPAKSGESKTVTFKNVSASVQKLLEAVRKTRQSKERETSELKEFRYDTQQELKDFIMQV